MKWRGSNDEVSPSAVDTAAAPVARQPRASGIGAARRSRIVSVVKLTIGVALLAALLLRDDVTREVVDLVHRFEPKYLIALVAIALMMRWISTVKWWMLLRHRGIRIAFRRLFALYLIGQFFNNFIPSMIGGDVTKIYLLGRQIGSHSRSAASVFVDRLTGFTALILLVLTFSLLNVALMADPVIGLSVAGTVAACTIIMVLIVYGRAIARHADRFLPIGIVQKLVRPLVEFHHEVVSYRHSIWVLLAAFACSAIFYFFAGLSIYFSSAAIGFFPPITEVALVTPIIFLVTSVPVTPNNIGWWEWCVSVLLSGAGAGMADGVMVALTMRVVSTSISLLGGLLFLMERFDHPDRCSP